MKILCTSFVFCLMIVFIGCSQISVQHDYDKNADFKSLETYNWLPIPKSIEINRLDIKRIKNAVNTQLEAKGLRMTSDDPDFLIATHINIQDRIDGINVGESYGYRYGGRLYIYEEGTLVLDFLEAQSKNVIWRGVGKGALERNPTPEKREKNINKAVEKILESFPPPL